MRGMTIDLLETRELRQYKNDKIVDDSNVRNEEKHRESCAKGRKKRKKRKNNK